MVYKGKCLDKKKCLPFVSYKVGGLFFSKITSMKIFVFV